MANEIKYLSYDGLDYFWKNKLKPLILEDEQVTATALTDLNDRINMCLPLSGEARMAGSILPDTTNAYTLGDANKKWSAVHAANINATTVTASSVYAGRFYGDLTGLANGAKMVQINPVSANTYYPIVFSQNIATSAPANSALGVDSSTTAMTNTAVGIRYNPSSHSCYCSSGFYEMSDERLKNFGDDIDVDLDKLSQLSKKYFTWKDDKSNVQHIGVSAQEIQTLYPEVVDAIDEEGHLSVSYDKLSVIALKGIDVLNDKVKSLEERITKLEKLIDTK